MQPAIDLTVYRFKKVLGEITLYGTWIWNDDQEKSEPALVLVPTFRRIKKVAGVALSAAFKYDDPRYLVRAAHQLSIEMGFEPSMALTHKIGTIIHDHLDDLVLMRPEPTTERVGADATVMRGDGQTKTFEMIERRRATS
jgi:hypothetical protein